jgi:ankyrin repeat protein
VECVRLLLENGADVNLKDKEGATPLQHAAFSGSHKSLIMLIDAGADMSAKDKEGSIALHKAAYQVSASPKKKFPPTSLLYSAYLTFFHETGKAQVLGNSLQSKRYQSSR